MHERGGNKSLGGSGEGDAGGCVAKSGAARSYRRPPGPSRRPPSGTQVRAGGGRFIRLRAARCCEGLAASCATRRDGEEAGIQGAAAPLKMSAGIEGGGGGLEEISDNLCGNGNEIT